MLVVVLKIFPVLVTITVLLPTLFLIDNEHHPGPDTTMRELLARYAAMDDYITPLLANAPSRAQEMCRSNRKTVWASPK